MKINQKKLFNSILFALFTLFVSLYIASNAGYYEYQSKEKTELTKKQIIEFEKDIANGKKVNIKNYLKKDTKNYDNKITKLGNRVEDIIDYGMKSTFEATFKFFEKLIE